LSPRRHLTPTHRRPTQARAIVFDVNETLLDLRALDGPFERVFGDASVRTQWFGQLLQSALVSIVTDSYADFGSIGRSALEMVARRRGTQLSDDDAREILGAVRTLPPHPEVGEALRRLRDADLRLATLTNSTEAVARAQLEHAGISGAFERILSADSVRRLKPAPEPYHMAAHELGVGTGSIRLVAAHPWDVAGALRAGAAAAFVARPGAVLDPLAPAPDIVGADLLEVAERIIAAEAPA
jgi:2-haloacid dehalogenase